MKVRLVCATRFSSDEFFKKSALGQSFTLYKPLMSDLEIYVFPNNTQGLPDVYNEAIEHAATDPAILVFAHDDVHLNDFYWCRHLVEGLKLFDIVGPAGNKRRAPRQASWYFLDADDPKADFQYLSGIVGHGSGFPVKTVAVFGEVEQECKLLDGLLMAVKSSTLIKHQLRFDPQFKFHFYDMDFCRQAELKGLKMGTCRISVIHESNGNFDHSWKQVYRQYLLKYGE